jgi:hypothetical protein
LTDLYTRLAATLWFLPAEKVEDLFKEAKEMILKKFRAVLEG